MANYRLTHSARPAAGPQHPAAPISQDDAMSFDVAILTGDATRTCGVGDFAKGLAETLQRRGARSIRTIDLSDKRLSLVALWRRVAGAQTVVCNLPLVAWKPLLLRPLIALAMARLRGRRVVVILHEWSGLHGLRRFVLRPAIALATRVVMLSPTIRQELASDFVLGHLARDAALMPLPPNVIRPAITVESEFSRKLAESRRAGRLVIGVFGSIYPGKQPLAALSLATALKARGHDPLIAFIGNFVRASDNIEEIFWNHVREHSLEENVAVSRYVESDAELYGIFAHIGVFMYQFHEGMTARRSSVLAAVQSGRPIVTTQAARADEFSHHPRFAGLIESNAITCVARGAAPQTFVDAVVFAHSTPDADNPIEPRLWWDDLADAIDVELAPR